MDSYVFRCHPVKLLEIATIERAVSKKEYPAKSIIVQVSACRKVDSNIFKLTQEAGLIESKYAVVIPKAEVNTVYLQIALNKAAGMFMRKYVGDNINIQIQAFENFELDFHEDRETQEYIAMVVEKLEDAENAEKNIVDNWKEIKKYMLSKMMC